MTFKGVHPRYDQWLIFETKKALYNTATSGDLVYTYKRSGELADFYTEY